MRLPSHIGFIIATAILAVSIAYQSANAQEPLQSPGPELSIPGSMLKSPVIAPAINDSAIAHFRGAEARTLEFKGFGTSHSWCSRCFLIPRSRTISGTNTY
jgi:hypothetical protein